MAFLRAGTRLERKKRNIDDLNAEHAPNDRERLFPDREDGKRQFEYRHENLKDYEDSKVIDPDHSPRDNY